MILGDIRYGNRLFVDIHCVNECGMLRHGWPPSLSVMVRHQAALAFGKLTRVTSGVNLPPSEVIMSRQRKLYRFSSFMNATPRACYALWMNDATLEVWNA